MLLATDIHNEYVQEHYHLLIHPMINEQFHLQHYLNSIKSLKNK